MFLANDLCAPEGPLPLADASLLLVEGVEERSCVTHLNADGKTRSCIRKTDRPIGLAMSADGAMRADAPKTPRFAANLGRQVPSHYSGMRTSHRCGVCTTGKTLDLNDQVRTRAG